MIDNTSRQDVREPQHSEANAATGLGSISNSICHHFHNYLICSAIYIAGAAATAHPEWVFVGQLGAMIGYVVMGLAVLLAILNTAVVVRFIWVEFKPMRGQVTGMPRGGNLRLFLLFMYLASVYVIVAVTINIKIASGDAGH